MKYKYDKAVVIGRFQPFHNGHASMLKKALMEAETVYVLIGSSNAYPNAINPFTAPYREMMIRKYLMALNLGASMKRVEFRYIPDSLYNEERWKTNVRMAIDETYRDKIAIYGYDKDAGSYWLKSFGWEHVKVDAIKAGTKDLSASDLRPIIFDIGNDWKSELSPYMHKSVIDALDIWMTEPTYWRLVEESKKWKSELDKFAQYPYPEALNCCTGDSVVVCNNHLLVIRRKFAPGQDALALPGGHKNANETFLDCAIRELLEEVRIKVPEKVIRGSIRNSMLFDHPKRSAYFSKPTVAQYIKLEPDHDGSLPRIMGGTDDAADAFWIPLHEVVQRQGEFFDDHYQIVTAFTGI